MAINSLGGRRIRDSAGLGLDKKPQSVSEVSFHEGLLVSTGPPPRRLNSRMVATPATRVRVNVPDGSLVNREITSHAQILPSIIWFPFLDHSHSPEWILYWPIAVFRESTLLHSEH